MKEEEIREILNSHQICFAQHGTLCATVKAGLGAYQNGLGEIMHTMKDHILHINAQGIAILAVDVINGALQEHTLLFLPHEDIVSINIKNSSSLHTASFFLCRRCIKQKEREIFFMPR